MKLLGDLIPDRSSFEPMSALDASFLAAETPHTPMHIGSLTLFEGAPFFDERGRFRLAEVQAHVAGRMSRIPNFRRRMATPPFGQGRPVWVDATDFDIADHVRLRILPEPGSRQELADLCSRLYAEPLDRAHPLWQLCFVGGLDDGNVAMVERVHHSLIDGISGVEVAAALLDTAPDPEAVEAPPWTPSDPPGPLALAIEGVWRDLTAALGWGRTVGSMLASPAAVLHRAQGLADSVASVLAPRRVLGSSVNADIGDRRHLEWVTVSLADVRAAAHRHHTTINDVVLAAVTGGFRQLLLERHEEVEGCELQALVPVSTHTPDQEGAYGNHVSAMVAPLPIGAASGPERLARITRAMGRHKGRHQADGAELLVESLELLPAAAAGPGHPVHPSPAAVQRDRDQRAGSLGAVVLPRGPPARGHPGGAAGRQPDGEHRRAVLRRPADGRAPGRPGHLSGPGRADPGHP